MRYAFDRLGFLQFEQLVAALLELEGGVPSHAWSGEADRCRTVLSGTRLDPPVVSAPAPAPVFIQCAWIRTGEASELLEAIARAAERQAADLRLAASFVLASNVDLDPGVPVAVSEQLRHRVRMLVLGPRELAERLDGRAELRRAMPSVLGLRDLSGLIDPAIAARSSLDRAAAVEVARVFVPTGAYRRALAVLGANRFVVLTGPPEMGKTAIAPRPHSRMGRPGAGRLTPRPGGARGVRIPGRRTRPERSVAAAASISSLAFASSFSYIGLKGESQCPHI